MMENQDDKTLDISKLTHPPEYLIEKIRKVSAQQEVTLILMTINQAGGIFDFFNGELLTKKPSVANIHQVLGINYEIVDAGTTEDIIDRMGSVMPDLRSGITPKTKALFSEMMSDKAESLRDQYDKEPLIVNEYSDECHVVDYYDVNKWISENKELANAMLAEGEKTASVPAWSGRGGVPAPENDPKFKFISGSVRLSDE